MSGMEESDMNKCHYMLGIPTNPKFGSLNLASAVQLIAHDWRMALGNYDTEFSLVSWSSFKSKY